jgi:hypothetical protein
MWYGKDTRIRLLKDLTRYHPGLTVGVEGTLMYKARVGDFGGLDRFGAVRFDCGAYLDIVIDSLEFLEEPYKTSMAIK